MFISIGNSATMIGVAISTLRRWDAEGYLIPDYRTKGNHRRYSLSSLKQYTHYENINKFESQEKQTILYSRVSESDQKADLQRQQDYLKSFAQSNRYRNCLEISDLGSGLKYDKPGFKKLIRLILEDRIERIVLTHKDRLLLFGADIVFQICKWKSIDIIILKDELTKSFEEELTQDIICLMVVFTARLYGKRSHRNRRKKKQQGDKSIQKPSSAFPLAGGCHG